jgi:hypothetical protein
MTEEQSDEVVPRTELGGATSGGGNVYQNVPAVEL